MRDLPVSYRTILVPVDDVQGGDERICLAADLARTFGATLVGVGAQPFDASSGITYGMFDGGVLETVRDQIDADLGRWERRLAASAGSIDAGVHWMGLIASPDNAIYTQAREADLIVTSRSTEGKHGFYALPSAMLMETGAPLLLAPQGQDQFDGRVILVAWKDGREARRAISDSLPFLSRAKHVVALEVGDHGNGETSSDSLRAIGRRLGRHGIDVELRAEVCSGCVASDIFKVADDIGAGLIVAGAYGHSRLREWALGGVTEELLDHARRPVFLAR